MQECLTHLKGISFLSPRPQATSMQLRFVRCRLKSANCLQRPRKPQRSNSKTPPRSNRFKPRVRWVKSKDNCSRIVILCWVVRHQSTSCSTWFCPLVAHTFFKTTMIHWKELLTSAWTDQSLLAQLRRARNTCAPNTLSTQSTTCSFCQRSPTCPVNLHLHIWVPSSIMRLRDTSPTANAKSTLSPA